MAIYLWQCECGHEQYDEKSMSESDIPPVECDVCGNRDRSLWEKLIQRTSFVLNGGGWFKDSYQKQRT